MDSKEQAAPKPEKVLLRFRPRAHTEEAGTAVQDADVQRRSVTEQCQAASQAMKEAERSLDMPWATVLSATVSRV